MNQSEQLPQCCLDALKEIEEKKTFARAINRTLPVLQSLFLVKSMTSEKYLLEIYNATKGGKKWEVFGRAMQSIPTIERNRCKTIAGLHKLKHNGGRLNRFWISIYNLF